MRLPLTLAIVLSAAALPAAAEVRSVTLGISVNCPYGLAS